MNDNDNHGLSITSGRRQVHISGMIVAVVMSIVTAAIIGGFTAIIDTREDVARLDQRVGRAEQDSNALTGLPMAIARLEAKVDNLYDEVNKLRAERRR